MADPYFSLDGTSIKLTGTALMADTIAEKTAAAGVTIDGVKLKDSQPYCDVINEKTTAAGVTIDGLLIKDGKAPALSSKIITATRDMTAASGDVAYTGVGFMPSSIQVVVAINASFAFCVGFADSLKAGATVSQYLADTFNATNYLINIAPSNTVQQLAIVKTYDADGFTLTWTKVSTPTGTATIKFLCFR